MEAAGDGFDVEQRTRAAPQEFGPAPGLDPGPWGAWLGGDHATYYMHGWGGPAASAAGPGTGRPETAVTTAAEMDQLRERLQQLEAQQAAGRSWSPGWWSDHQRDYSWRGAGDRWRAHSWKDTDEVEGRPAKDTSDPPEWPGWEQVHPSLGWDHGHPSGTTSRSPFEEA